MPLSQKKLDENGVPIALESRGSVTVRQANGGGTVFRDPEIPFDGRRYVCGGEIILANGRHLQAHFEIDTTARSPLDRASVRCTLDGDLWYTPDEPELAAALAIAKAEMKEFRWKPDRPLAGVAEGPYALDWRPAHP